MFLQSPPTSKKDEAPAPKLRQRPVDVTSRFARFWPWHWREAKLKTSQAASETPNRVEAAVATRTRVGLIYILRTVT